MNLLIPNNAGWPAVGKLRLGVVCHDVWTPPGFGRCLASDLVDGMGG